MWPSSAKNSELRVTDQVIQRPSTAVRVLAISAASLALLAVAIRLAWLGDDAYITLRSVENLASGNGLRWNPDDRVQTYTHPLWMLFLTLGRWLSGEVYYATIVLSLAASMVAVLGLLLRAQTVAAVIGTGVLLLCARAFGDYMTSGLETPLTFVLLVLFVANVHGDRSSEARYSRSVLLAALLATNRMDLAVLCLAPVVSCMRGVALGVLVRRGVLMSMPFLLWLVFAGIYYGSPLPVTGHAKAFGVGIPGGEMAEQGMRYMLHALLHDPVLLVTTVLGSMLLLLSNRSRWLALGALCYLAYVVKVGGGFMQGRFLLPPFVVVVACLPQWLARLPRKQFQGLLIVIVSLMLAGGLPPWATAPSNDTPLSKEVIEEQHGIVDERRMYYRELGLMSPTRQVPQFGALQDLAFPEGRKQRWWLLNGAVGSAGFGAGATGHVVDPLLCDALIARLPAIRPDNWRIGHVLRRIPEGYWETLLSGENRIRHPGLRDFYGALHLLTRTPVFSGDRLAALWQMAIGSHDAGFREFLAEEYRNPPRVEVGADQLSGETELGTFWFDQPALRIVYEGGLAVRFDEAVGARELRVQVLGTCAFRFRFLQAGQVFGEAAGVAAPPPAGLSAMRAIAGLREERVVVPGGVPQFDMLWVDFVELPFSDRATGPAALGAVTPQ